MGLDPGQAKSAITLLSNLLRHSINLGKQKLVKFEDEMELVKNYLELEKIRFEERLKVVYHINSNAINCKIPPLMVQTIVENSIKHGIAKSIDGGEIILDAVQTDGQLCIKIINSGKLDLGRVEEGVGVANTKKRLEILFKDNASFSLEQIGDDVVATIKITY